METLDLTAEVMRGHEVIIVEEPFHRDFLQVLEGTISIEDHLLELDVEYPRFTTTQYQLLQEFYRAGKQVLQIEPYLEHLVEIQFFLAEGHLPQEIEPDTAAHSVFSAERSATGTLIDYYNAARGNDFLQILTAMNDFARADARRFLVRDSLRAKQIAAHLETGRNVYIEAGSMHLYLYKLLVKKLSGDWHITRHSIDRETLKILNRRASLFSPGDILTLLYIWDRKVNQRNWQLACAQSLIYNLIVKKEELDSATMQFPHTQNELESIALARKLSINACKYLFARIQSLATDEAAEEVQTYIAKQGGNDIVC